MADAELYARNAAQMWASLAPWSRPVPGTGPGLAVIDIPAQRAARIILRQPHADPEQVGALVTAAAGRGRVVVEDSFGDLALTSAGVVLIDRMPVMIRPPAGDGATAGATHAPGSAISAQAGAIRAAAGAGTAAVRVGPATDEAALAGAERVIVDGFPRPALQPYRPGRMLPPLALTVPGWRTWLACHDGEPAAACCTYDDGAAVGVYWLATLPRHRSLGLGRAVMSAALAACPGRPAVLVATAAGAPLYASLGFRPVSQAAWYRIAGPAA